MSTPFEDEALAILREATGYVRVHGYPEGIELRTRLAELIREARKDAAYRAALAIAEAYELSLDSLVHFGDVEFLAQALDDHLPEGFAVRRPVTEVPAPLS